MVDVTIGQLLQEASNNASKTIFENLTGITKRDDVEGLSTGSGVVLVKSPNDIPFVNGFRQIEQAKSYLFLNPMTFTEPILIPAGYVGFLKTTFFEVDGIDYKDNATPFLNTLNIDGDITGIVSTNGGSAITVTTSAAHGLLDGQYVNISGTGVYDQFRLLISNASGSVFDIQIPFISDVTGFFDTAYSSIQLLDIHFTNSPNITTLFNLTSIESPTSTFLIQNFSELGFLGPGKIKNGFGLVFNAVVFGSIIDGLTLEDCDSALITDGNFASLSASSPNYNALTVIGNKTKTMVMQNVKFQMLATNQTPVRIDPNVTAADSIFITNCPDNLAATNYFDTTGLDQTDPQVITFNNGTRPNSMTLAEARSNGTLVVAGTGLQGVATPVVDITPVSGDWINDPTTETLSINITTGEMTYNGLNSISAKIEYSLEASAENPSQITDFTIHINGTPQTKTTRQITSTTTLAPITYNGGNFNVDPGDVIQLFKTNTNNEQDISVTNVTILFNSN